MLFSELPRFGLMFSLALAWSASSLLSAAHPQVPGFERFYAAENTDAAVGGRLLVSELNCRSCHKGESDGAGTAADKQAPILNLIGNRARPEWIRSFLANPHAAKPGTTMPDVLGSLPAEERMAHVESLTHFLANTGNVQDSHPEPAAIQRGKELFGRVGCLACHNPLGADSPQLATSVALPDLGAKYTAHSLATFLKDPLQARPSGRMPALGLKDEEYRDIAQFFLRDRKLKPNMKYTAYHGNWDKLPDFKRVRPLRSGESAGFDLTVGGRPNNFAVRFTSNLFLQKAGNYQFILGSDDGSRLLIDDELVVDNDGVHPHSEKRAAKQLAAGKHAIVVEYFQGGGEWTLTVDIEGNGLPRQSLSGLVSLSESELTTPSDEERFVVNQDLVAKGAELFASLGCASCHQMSVNEKKIASKITAKPWGELVLQGGCLDVAPRTGLPNYSLSPRQVAALRAAKDKPKTDVDPIHTTLATLNCYACHLRNEVGGVESARYEWFTSTQQEMGDEGKLPPTLTGVGDKLQDDWLKTVLDKGADDRLIYMNTRMPKFGGRNIGHLAAAFIAADRQPESLPVVEFSEPDYRVKADGRHLVGAKALSCIKCHDFGKLPSQGVRAVSLTTMTRRLRRDWFDRYMRNPTEFRPGTRMPAPWPFGQATVRDVLNANVDQQIAAVWLYLADGDKAALPVGLVREPIELVAEKAPVIYRNFIEGAGSRGIGVGYPEHLNLAWDANDMRLALIWHGAFIDASRHWNGRGVGFEAPLGDHVVKLPEGQPLAKLVSPNDPWPTGMARDNGYRFRGYSLDAKQRPTFRASQGDIALEDFCEPLATPGRKDPGLRRTITITGPSSEDRWYFRVVTANEIAAGDNARTWLVDQNWTLSLNVAAIIREVNNRKELLIPLEFHGQPIKLTLDYVW